MTTNTIDENNLLVFDPSSASIIFTVGEGVLTKSKKIVASLTQALLLFSDKVVAQEISFIRFQNHRMVFIHEQDLYGVKLVPKDQLTKNFVPAIKILLNIQNQLRSLDPKIRDQADNILKTFYNLIKSPEKNLYIFSESIEGYLSLLTVMAALTYDLSINLESIKRNFLILKNDDASPFETMNLEQFKGVISFGLNIKNITSKVNSLEVVQLDLKDSIFNTIFPNNKALFKLISQVVGIESSSYIISQIINREQSINEVALSLVKLPNTELAVEIAIEAISNFSKEQRLAKPLYRIIIKKLKDLEGSIEPGLLQEVTEASESNTEIKRPEKNVGPIAENPSVVIPTPISKTVQQSQPTQPAQTGFSSSELTSLANEFTSKLETLTQTEVNEVTPVSNFVSEKASTVSENKPNFTQNREGLVVDKNHLFMENFKVYYDFAPYRLGTKPEDIQYRPSVQVLRIDNDKTQFNVKINPEKHNWFLDIIKSLSEKASLTYKGEEGNFQIETINSNLVDVLRVISWSCIIDLLYAIQNGEMELPQVLNITNKSNLCIILELTPERRKQLPSQIEVIVEEDKQLSGSGVEDQVKSFDTTLNALSTALNSKKGVGFVLRKNSKELPLVLEFILSMSEICGIGWSRW